jgi:hypothetical protein
MNESAGGREGGGERERERERERKKKLERLKGRRLAASPPARLTAPPTYPTPPHLYINFSNLENRLKIVKDPFPATGGGPLLRLCLGAMAKVPCKCLPKDGVQQLGRIRCIR